MSLRQGCGLARKAHGNAVLLESSVLACMLAALLWRFGPKIVIRITPFGDDVAGGVFVFPFSA